jgi:hypothetical protein
MLPLTFVACASCVGERDENVRREMERTRGSDEARKEFRFAVVPTPDVIDILPVVNPGTAELDA